MLITSNKIRVLRLFVWALSIGISILYMVTVLYLGSQAIPVLSSSGPRGGMMDFFLLIFLVPLAIAWVMIWKLIEYLRFLELAKEVEKGRVKSSL
ncbi:hypothetical protein B1C78_05005 [Thioalkalivibrio denitrificans]|uniref:DUF485 domain-containing protein n=1 Tax=Thioalkalivibrio denitrificans TaxID=108003 RepID=A0A1V3NNU7_9GAMM|nr:hypothetical protein B1C78_05005 [Thioalkalivibrio denitrificans]